MSSPAWKIEEEMYDPETTDAPNIEIELKRLQVLKAFHLLDAEVEGDYDRVAALAIRVFGVKLAMVNLVDLGRTWRVAGAGFPAAFPREEPRRSSFCAHTILHRGPSLVVPDASLDFRFQDSSWVASGVRFYAGAVLTSPEGARIGTLSIMDRDPRPAFSEENKQKLVDMAAKVMALIVANRAGAHLKRLEENDAAMDLDGSRQADESHGSFTQNEEHFQTMATDNQRSTVQTTWNNDGFLYSSQAQKPKANPKEALNYQTKQETTSGSSDRNNPIIPPTAFSKAPEKKVRVSEPISVLHFIHDLESAMDVFPKKVQLTYTVDRHVPQAVHFDALKVFRSAIALLASACERTEVGFIAMQVYCRKRDKQDDSSNVKEELVFETVDTGPDVPLDRYSTLFVPPTQEQDIVWDYECLSLQKIIDGHENQHRRQIPSDGFAVYPVAYFMESINGDYGYRRRITTDEHDSQPPQTGSMFWFSVPLRPVLTVRASDTEYHPTSPTRLQQRIVKQMYRSRSSSGSL